MKSFILKSNEIKGIIVKDFGNKLSQHGFIYKKTTNEFRNKVGEYTYIFSIDLVSWSNSYSLDVKLYISVKQIEDILEKIIGKLRYRKTLGQDIGRIYKSPNGRDFVRGNLTVWIRQNEDVESLIETLVL
jgi:hypothetical protein